MAVSQQRTRAQIRQSIGLITDMLWQDNGVTSSPSEAAPSAGKIIDQNLAFGTEDEHRGRWLWYTDSNAANDQRRVLASSPSERSLDVSVPFPVAPDSAWSYELWDGKVSPTMVHESIDQAITETTRKGSVPLTSDSIHTGGNVNAWGLSSTISGVRFVEWRHRFTGEQVTSLDDAMTAGANATVATDSKDVKEGSGVNVVTIAAGAGSTETLATDCFSTVNIRGYTHVDIWAKSNVTTTSSNLQVTFNEGSTVRETLGFPALNADSWTRVNLPLANPELDSAITRMVFETGSSDGGSATVLLDDVVTYRARAEEWVTVPRDSWSLDKDRRELRLSENAGVPYAKLQVTAVQKPSLLDTDTEVAQIDPQYIVNAAASKIFRMIGEDGRANTYEALAQQQRVRMNTPSNVKWLDD